MYIGTASAGLICRLVSINRTCSNLASYAGTCFNDHRRHHDHPSNKKEIEAKGDLYGLLSFSFRIMKGGA